MRNLKALAFLAEKVLARRNSRDLDRAVASLSENLSSEPSGPIGFRLGEDGNFRSYENQYSINDYAKSPQMRAKERDRKKYLCTRFALGEEGAFEVGMVIFKKTSVLFKKPSSNLKWFLPNL